MSEENKEQQPTRPAGVRQTRGAAGAARGGVRQTRGGAPAGVRQTRGGAAGARPAGVKTTAPKTDAKVDEGEAPVKKPAGPPPDPKVLLKKFLPVYIVKSDVVELNCLMCRNQLDEVCNTCRQQRITDPSQCPVIQGKCGHKFHMHCIQGWLKDHTNCPHPGCDTRWENA